MGRDVLRVVFGAVAVSAIAVASVPAANAAVCTGAAEVSKVTLMADWLAWASQGPMIAAQQEGFYKDEGLELEIVAPANPADPIKLVAAEQVPFSLTYVPEVMLANEANIPVIAVAATMRVLSSGLFFMPESEINGPADLKGKILGVGPKQDAQAFLATILEAGGLTKDDVKMVDPGYAHVPLTMTGKVAGAHGLTYGEGVVANDELSKLGRQPTKWIMYTDYGVPAFYYQVIVGSKNWLEKNPNTACRFLRATIKGIDVWLKSPGKVNDAIAKANEAFTPEQHVKIYDGTKDHWLAADGTAFKQDAAVWAEARDWALKRGLLASSVDTSNYFTNAYLPE